MASSLVACVDMVSLGGANTRMLEGPNDPPGDTSVTGLTSIVVLLMVVMAVAMILVTVSGILNVAITSGSSTSLYRNGLFL